MKNLSAQVIEFLWMPGKVLAEFRLFTVKIYNIKKNVFREFPIFTLNRASPKILQIRVGTHQKMLNDMTVVGRKYIFFMYGLFVVIFKS